MTNSSQASLPKLDGLEELVVHRPLCSWKFELKPKTAKCRLAKDSCTLFVTLKGMRRDRFPDVCKIEGEVELYLTGNPTTAEDFALWVADRYGFLTTVRLESHLHGPLTATAEPASEPDLN